MVGGAAKAQRDKAVKNSKTKTQINFVDRYFMNILHKL
jgi:hypothetical protein